MSHQIDDSMQFFGVIVKMVEIGLIFGLKTHGPRGEGRGFPWPRLTFGGEARSPGEGVGPPGGRGRR